MVGHGAGGHRGRAPGPRSLLRAGEVRWSALAVLVALIATWLLPSAAQATGENRLHNGDFQEEAAGWWGLGVSEGAVIDDGWACLLLGSDATFGNYSGFPIDDGEEHHLGFTVSGTSEGGQLQVIVQVDGRDDASDLVATFEVAEDAQRHDVTFVGEHTTGTASNNRLVFHNDGADEVEVCISEVTLLGAAEETSGDTDERDTTGEAGSMDDEADDTTTGDANSGPARPRLHVNQVGYLADGPRFATLVFAPGEGPDEGVPWELRNGDGAVVADGLTEPRGFDPSAGFDTHVLDLSDAEVAGQGLTLVANGHTSHPFTISGTLYRDLRRDALRIYYSQRSGIEIDDDLKPGYGRPAGHTAAFGGDQINQGDLEVPCLPNEGAVDHQGTSQAGGFDHYGPDGWDCPEGYTRDVAGGWYDAGDHGKYVVNSGISVWQLLNAYERDLHYGRGDGAGMLDDTLAIPESGNGVPDLLDEVRWNLEWMLSMQVPDGTTMGLAGDEVDAGGLVHHKLHDVAWTGLDTFPHEDPMPRYLHRPSTAATLNLAAVAAQGARLYEAFDADFAEDLRQAAVAAWDAAEAHPDLYAPDTNVLDSNPGGGPYDDDDVSDEFYWAAAQLWLTTGEDRYLDALAASDHHAARWDAVVAFDWQEVAAAGRLDLALFGQDLPDHDEVVRWVLEGADRYLDVQAAQPFGHPYGTEHYEWGSTHHVINNAVVLAVAHDLSGEQVYRDGAIQAMDYVLGRNAVGNSYVTGYGTRYSQHMHSRWYAHSVSDRMPPPPPGKVAGGANSGIQDPVAQANLQGCAPQACYIDDIGSWSTNETTINWNASLAWLAAWIDDVGGEPGEPSEATTSEASGDAADAVAEDMGASEGAGARAAWLLAVGAVVAAVVGGLVWWRSGRKDADPVAGEG